MGVAAVNDHTVKANAQEAMLVDWVLTLHNYDSEYLEFLMKPDIQQLRYQAGKIIIDGEGHFELLEEELKWLLAVVPITFRFSKEDVGFSLKKKLYESLLGKKLEGLLKEVGDANHDET